MTSLTAVQCDEHRPNCHNCRDFHVKCNFTLGTPDLVPVSQNGHSQPRPAVNPGLWVASFRPLDAKDRELLHRFRCRTLRSLGGAEMEHMYSYLFRDCFAVRKPTNNDRANCQYPFLMHSALAMAALHDRHGTLQRRTPRESYHISQCTSHLVDCVSRPLVKGQKDAIWAAAVNLAILTLSSNFVNCTNEAWPLSDTDTSTLDWMRLKASDKALWYLADPTRKESVFRTISPMLSQIQRQVCTQGVDGMHPVLAEACGLDESSTGKSPYFTFAHGVSMLLDAPKGEESLGVAFTAVYSMSESFRTLLVDKDSVALALLYLWFSRARWCRWWLDFRAHYTMPATDKYIRQHGDVPAVNAILSLAKT